MKIAFVFNLKTEDTPEQAEFDSSETVDSIASALASGGHQVVKIPMPRDDSRAALAAMLRQVSPDFVFNTAEGSHGQDRESLGPSVYEALGIPFVGTGARGCQITLDKAATKRVVEAVGAKVLPGRLVRHPDELKEAAAELGYPLFVKPNFEGSSKGITHRSICHDEHALASYGLECLAAFPEGVLIERFMPGRDIGVAFVAGLGEKGALEPVEYVLGDSSKDQELIYDYALKNVDDSVFYLACPAPIPASTRATLLQTMQRIVPALGIADFARADFRLSADGEAYFLEINALPSLQKGAAMFDAAALLGLSYEQTILHILNAARARHGLGASLQSHSPALSLG